MRPLELSLSGHRPAVNGYTQMSNLNRIASYNHDKLTEWLTYNHREYKNQSLLVQALSQLNISASMSIDYLVEWVKLKTESVASTLKISGVFDNGVPTNNTIFQPEFTEQFILLPSKSSYLDYLDLDDSLISPIVPLFSNETIIDYVGPVLNGPTAKRTNSKFAIIGVDLLGLAIHYWSFLRGEGTLNKSAHHFLTGAPLLNARIYAHRCAMLEVLYNGVFSERLLNISIEQLDQTPLNDITGQLSKYLTFVFNHITKVGLYDEQDLLNQFPFWGDMPVDPLQLQGEKYLRYGNTQWVWNLIAMKILALVIKVNKISERGSDNAKAKAQKWLTQDTAGMIRNFVPQDLRVMYQSYIDDLKNAIS